MLEYAWVKDFERVKEGYSGEPATADKTSDSYTGFVQMTALGYGADVGQRDLEPYPSRNTSITFLKAWG